MIQKPVVELKGSTEPLASFECYKKLSFQTSSETTLKVKKLSNKQFVVHNLDYERAMLVKKLS
jgi:hypothetical protein